MPHFEDPPPKDGAVVRAAMELARSEPGRWVFVKEYSSQQVANATGWKLKGRIGKDEIETRTFGAKLFLRTHGRETK